MGDVWLLLILPSSGFVGSNTNLKAATESVMTRDESPGNKG